MTSSPRSDEPSAPPSSPGVISPNPDRKSPSATSRRRPRRGGASLSHQLVVRVSLVVAAVLMLTTLIALLAVRQVLVDQMDVQLHAVAARQARSETPDGDQQAPRGATELGNPIGTIIVEQHGSFASARVVSEGALVVPSGDVIADLLNLPDDGEIRTLVLDDFGSYRVISVTRGDGTYVAALPLKQVNQMTMRVLLFMSALTLVAIAVAVMVTRPLVHRSLRPLHRLAETAHQVGQLDLRTGEVALPMRALDTDPGNEVGQVGRAFNQMLDNVESALAARQESETKVRRFVADASHELRNPLASIRGYAELTRRGREALPDQSQFAMQRIESESSRMSSLVEDLLLLARLDSDPNLQPEPVDCVEVVLNAVSDARAAGGGQRWQVDLPSHEVLAMADRHRLVQVVVNLLSNARKHTPAGTVVTASVRSEPGWVLIEVADTGPGIPEAVSGQVFERFARADVARAHSAEPSTGLGLAIVEAVMAAHGGTATVSSRPGDTRFQLRFPAAPAQD